MNFLRDNATVLLLAGAAVGWYAASHAAAGALAGERMALRRRVVGHWLPILAAALLALLAGQTDVAVGILFATSVAVLSLVLGIVTVTHEFSAPGTSPGGFPVIETAAEPSATASSGPTEVPPDGPRRIWAFVLPAAILALLAGFRGVLSLTHAAVFLIEGLAIWALWPGRTRLSVESEVATSPALRPDQPATDGLRPIPAAMRGIQLIFAVGVAVVAGWAGLRAGESFSGELGLLSGGFVTATLLAPALVLPMIGTGMLLARANLYPAAVTTSVGIVLLNLCLGLPMLIAVWSVRPHWDDRVNGLSAMISPPGATAAAADPTTTPATAPATEPGPVSPAGDHPPLRFPLATWRVDTVLLIVLGLLLVPLALGRWMPGRFEGVLMIGAYVVYMFLSTLAARA